MTTFNTNQGRDKMTTISIHDDHRICFEEEGSPDNMCFNCAIKAAMSGFHILTHVQDDGDEIVCDRCGREA